MSGPVGLALSLRARDLLRNLLQLALLGLLVGLACWPLNLVDRWQDRVLSLLPAFSGKGWGPVSLALALSPLVVVPLLLLLQRGILSRGVGSGIPQTMTSIEHPAQAANLLGWVPTLQRAALWSVASLSLLPIGREGPVVQVGASVAHALRKRFPNWFSGLGQADLLAVSAGAGLAGGFDTPLLGVVFVAEEFVSSFAASMLWPAMVIGAMAATFSNIAGQPMFALGTVGVEPIELMQVLWALPLGVLGGVLGGAFAKMLLAGTKRCLGLVRRYPLRLGLAVGALLSVFLLLSGGASGGDGELLMGRLFFGSSDGAELPQGFGIDLLNLLLRVVGPVLALSTGIPGGLIDPSFAFGAVLGQLVADQAGSTQLCLALGMVAGLAGATQLPVMAVLFGVRLAGDQQLLSGLLVASVIAAYVSRQIVAKPIYHALHAITAEPAPTTALR
jgi:H+/Cl- antiporter ClcA